MSTVQELETRLLRSLGDIRDGLGMDRECGGAAARFADVLDSMGFVEFLAVVAEDLGATPAVIEATAGRRFDSIANLARSLAAAGFPAARHAIRIELPRSSTEATHPPPYPAATSVQLPALRQTAEELDVYLGRPPGWLRAHAGITGRGVWAGEDPLDAAARAAVACCAKASVAVAETTALVVVAEAPPQAVGLAAAVHHRLGLPAGCPALEMGGACTGFLSAMWCARRILSAGGAVLLLAIEAPSRWLALEPGPAGEAAALFGDGAAACLLTPSPSCDSPLSLLDVRLETAGEAGPLLEVGRAAGGGFDVKMDGKALARRAVEAMASVVQQLLRRYDLAITAIDAVVMHAGNGRMPNLLARQLGLPAERLFSCTSTTGNLGPASLPATWALSESSIPSSARQVIWTAAGAGLQSGAALWCRAGG
jgi:3-oxoacyl-[acyl-carrier-protein] synthase-3